MIAPSAFYDGLRSRGISFFSGVPDSLLKAFCAYVDDHAAPGEHVIAANEGNAIALAAGYHLATGRVGVVYMQNSGLGNAVNPLASLADSEVYRIPVLLVIGWRGEPGVKDEPQHVKQGRITPGLLDVLEIPYRILESDSSLEPLLDDVFATVKKTAAPVALLVRKKVFEPYESMRNVLPISSLCREEALGSLLDLLGPNDLIVSTTGKTSRELYEWRVRRGEKMRDFLTVGSMGHTSSIALGVALGRPDRRVICLDGDGSLLMHMGALPVLGNVAPRNLVHVVLNNAAHESVGGQPTVADRLVFGKLAEACGYKGWYQADSLESISAAWADIESAEGPVLLEIKLACGSRPDLGRPTTTPEENKREFMRFGREE